VAGEISDVGPLLLAWAEVGKSIQLRHVSDTGLGGGSRSLIT
jgi:hypothetical protein